MKGAAIACFALSGLTAIQWVLLTAAGIRRMEEHKSDLPAVDFFSQSVGGIMIPLGLLIVGLIFRKKATRPPPLPQSKPPRLPPSANK